MNKKWPKIFGITLATLALTGCTLFTNANNYANSFNETAFKYVTATGSLSFSMEGENIIVSFTDEDTGLTVQLDDEDKVASFGIAKVAFDDMRFDGNDLVAMGDYSRFSIVDNELFYKDITSVAKTSTIPYTQYKYSSKEVTISDARALRVTWVNDDLKSSLPNGFGDYADVSVGDYLNIYIETSETGTIGEEVKPFISDDIAGALFAETVTTGDENDATVVTNVYFADETDTANKFLLEDQSSTTTVIEYRYFDLIDAEGNVLLASPSSANFEMVEDNLYYIVSDGITETARYSISLTGAVLEKIVTIDPIVNGYLVAPDTTLVVGAFNGIHILASLVEA